MLHRVFVRYKGLDVEGVRPGLGILKAVFAFEPEPVTLTGRRCDQDGLALHVFETFDLFMGNQNLGIFLEHGCQRHHG